MKKSGSLGFGLNTSNYQEPCDERVAARLMGQGADGFWVWVDDLPLFFHGWGISYWADADKEERT